MDLVGISEIAEILGVTRGGAHHIARQPGFPKQYNDNPLKQGRVWKRQAIERWAKVHRPNERNA